MTRSPAVVVYLVAAYTIAALGLWLFIALRGAP